MYQRREHALKLQAPRENWRNLFLHRHNAQPPRQETSEVGEIVPYEAYLPIGSGEGRKKHIVRAIDLRPKGRKVVGYVLEA